ANHGGSWEAQSSGTSARLSAVWGSGPDNVFVVGQHGTVLHSTGNGSWVAWNSGVTDDLLGVGPGLVIVGASGRILFYANGQFLPQTSGTAQPLFGYWNAGTSVFAVGSGGTILQASSVAGMWTSVPSGTSMILHSIWGSRYADLYNYDLYAVGGVGAHTLL